MKEFFDRLFRHPDTVVKFIVAFVGAVGVAVSLGLLPDTVGKWTAVIIAFLTSLGVYGGNNKTDAESAADRYGATEESL